MLKNNLSILLSERNIKVLRLSNETGIARSTISKIASNKTDKISMEVVNLLCNNLKVTPNDFFSYIPYDFKFNFLELTENDFKSKEDFNSNIIEQRYGFDYPIKCYYNVTKYSEKYKSFEFNGFASWTVDLETNEETYLKISLQISDNEGVQFFNEISIDFQTLITEELKSFLIKNNKFVTSKTLVEINYSSH
ncbi:helix-turn-helix domain-containing protein [Streptococcus suis]|nr:helix-turn-helix transcriptional regulator [Streptococcus suis]NQJ74592.1 helix-turn-helix transcriptional regulator [Streptococcus suis]NQJ78743.1 helix-turn-helix transcriptional regulator [Streptococcus suis]NQK42244.1 helix-turn-helix transcriptional regulator [Streptococcus suis]NQM14096.1 helix-turn-helix transcriptional regulator [Streptococcus suis]